MLTSEKYYLVFLSRLCFSILRGEHINAFSTQHIVCVPTCTESIFVFTDMCWTVCKHYMKPKSKTKEKHVELCNWSFIYMWTMNIIGMRRIKGCVDSVSEQWDVFFFFYYWANISLLLLEIMHGSLKWTHLTVTNLPVKVICLLTESLLTF